MALRLAKDILHFLREQASHTSVRKLQREGIKNVTVIDMDAIEDLVTRAVDRVLRQADLDPAQTARLGRDARVEFLRLLEERQSLRDSLDSLEAERRALADNLGKLQSALTSAESDLKDQKQLAAKSDAEEAEMEVTLDPDLVPLQEKFDQALSDRLERLPEDLRNEVRQQLEGVTSHLAEQAKGYVHDEKERARDEERQARQDKIDNLERRVKKLRTALNQTEDMLERVRATKEVDHGVASIYDSVQGINEGEKQYERKKGLLSEIFKLNVELNELIADQKQGSSP